MLNGLRLRFVLAVLWFGGVAAQAQTWSLPLFTGDPQAVLAAAAQYAAGDEVPGLVLDRSIEVQIDETGRMQKTSRSVIKVRRVQGIDLVQRISIPWSLVRNTRPEVKARVITSDGQAHSLEPARILERDPQNQSAVGTVKVLAFTLPDVDVDSVVELEIVEADKEPDMPGARFGEIELPAGLPIMHFVATISSVGANELRVDTRSFPGAKIRPVATAKGHSFSVEASRFSPGSAGDYLPSDVAPFPTIVFSNVPSWQAAAQWYATALDKVAGTRAAGKIAVAGDTLHAAEKVYEAARAQVKDNGLDASLESLAPPAPTDILKAATGNSRDQAVVLLSKLRDAGVRAELAFVSAAPRADVLPSVPGLEAFNHALVYVPGATPLWIDPAADLTPVSQLPPASQNRWALIIDAATKELVRTSGSTEKENHQSSAIEIQVGDGAPTKVFQKVEANGAFGPSMRGVLNKVAQADEADRPGMLTPLFRGAGGQRVDSVKYSDAHDLLGTSWLEITGTGYAPAAISDDAGYVDLPGLGHLNFQALTGLLGLKPGAREEEPTTRTIDYEVAPAFNTENSFRVMPPLGYRIKEPTVAPAITLGPLSIVTSTDLDKDGSFRLSYKVTQIKTRLTPKEVEAARSEARKIADRVYQRVEYENVATAKMKTGDFATALQLLKRDSEEAKDTINPSLRLATGYVDVGARDAAAKLCSDLLNSAGSKIPGSTNPLPDSAVAAVRARLGWIYEHDPFGRFMAPGMNPAEAEKNLKEAIDSGDSSATFQLADLYTFNSAGVPFGRGAQLERAASILNHTDLDAVARSGRLNEYALLLLHAHKYSQLHEFFLFPQSETVDQSIRWAAFAASRSDGDLIQELEFRVESAAQRRVLLLEAARHLIAIREYAVALRVLKLAGGGKTPAASPADLERLGRVHPFDQNALSKEPAVAAFQGYVEALLNPENSADWKNVMSADNHGSSLQEQRNLLLQELAPVVIGNPSREMWPYLADVVDTALVLSSQGSDAVGFRIKASATSGGPAVTLAYVIKQDKDYVVAGPANSDAVTVQAVRLARAGNTPAAREWLDWGREVANRPRVSDADVNQVLDSMSGQRLLHEGKAQEASVLLLRAHQENPSDVATTFMLADSLIQSGRAADATPYIDQLNAGDSSGLLGLRLRAHQLAQQRNYSEAAAVEKQICSRPAAAAVDWNDFAWTMLFTGENSGEVLTAAEKAATLTKFESAPVLHTLALAQATAGHLKDAVATGFRLDDITGDEGELRTIFGRIAEELGLADVARSDYTSVPVESAALSNYSYAQFRLTHLKPITKTMPNSSQ
jgi:tetratricopeptide (TPR) repeat protein